MSNKARSLAKKVIKLQDANDVMYNTTFGSLLTSIGILTGIGKDDLKTFFKECENNQNQLPNTIKELANFVLDHFNVTLPTGTDLALFTDNIRTPIICPYYGQVLPLSPNGYLPFIVLGWLKKGAGEMELVFEETENDESDKIE